MANQRTFLAQGLSLNGVAVGGLSTLGFSGRFGAIRGRPDGAVAVEEVSRAGLSVGFSMDCADVTAVNAILAAAKADTVFYAKESGIATFHKYTIPSGTAWIVVGSMNVSLSASSDGQLSCGGKMSFLDGSKTLANAISLVASQVAPTLVHPIRLAYPNAASFDPEGTPVAISPKHTSAVSLSLNGEIIEDFADNDISAVADLIGWGPLEVSWTFRDASVDASSNLAAKLVDSGYGVLSVPLVALGGQTAKTLTANNLLWTGVEQRDQKGYSEFTLRGEAGWRKGDGTV